MESFNGGPVSASCLSQLAIRPPCSCTSIFNAGDETYQTWYKVVGDLKSGTRPLVALHGAPGFSYDYMLPHAELFQSHGIPSSSTSRSVLGTLPIFPKEFWTVDFFMRELDNVLAHFGIAGDFDLLGHSWGGMLAAAYASSRSLPGSQAPDHRELGRVVAFAGGGRTGPAWGPEDVRETLFRHEAAGTTSSEEYQNAALVFYGKHICKLNPWPELLLKSIGAISDDPTVYHTVYVSVNGL